MSNGEQIPEPKNVDCGVLNAIDKVEEGLRELRNLLTAKAMRRAAQAPADVAKGSKAGKGHSNA